MKIEYRFELFKRSYVMVHLEPMIEAEFHTYIDATIAEYAAEHVKGGRWSPSEALAESRKEIMQLLPDGLRSVDQYLFSIKNEADDQVGMLWLAARNLGGKRAAFIYDVRIDEAFQRRGYATQAFQALEVLARDMGLSAISLHVFGHNTAARALYEKLGFITTNVSMTKSLENS